MFIGTILALVFSGLLCDSGVDNGWPLIFYVYGIAHFTHVLRIICLYAVWIDYFSCYLLFCVHTRSTIIVTWSVWVTGQGVIGLYSVTQFLQRADMLALQALY